jgi:nitroreductase
MTAPLTTPLTELDAALRRSGGPLLPHHADALVATAVRAPSLHNAQPWRFRVRDDVLELRADRTRQLWSTDPAGRQLAISCGAALFGLRLAVRHLGHRPDVRLLPSAVDRDLLAEVRADERVPADGETDRLLEAMAVRRSFRGRFDGPPVDPTTVVALRDAVELEGCRVVLVDRPGTRRAVADIVAAAERAQQSHPGVRGELEDWTPPAGSGRRDGVPESAYPSHPPAAGPQELTVRDFSGNREQGTPREVTLPVASPAPPLVAVLLTPHDGPADWLAAGQGLYRLLLTAAAAGVQASLHAQPTELDGLRRLLQDELIVDEQPQMLLQLGHVADNDPTSPPTPRRAVDDVLDR